MTWPGLSLKKLDAIWRGPWGSCACPYRCFRVFPSSLLCLYQGFALGRWEPTQRGKHQPWRLPRILWARLCAAWSLSRCPLALGKGGFGEDPEPLGCAPEPSWHAACPGLRGEPAGEPSASWRGRGRGQKAARRRRKRRRISKVCLNQGGTPQP